MRRYSKYEPSPTININTPMKSVKSRVSDNTPVRHETTDNLKSLYDQRKQKYMRNEQYATPNLEDTKRESQAMKARLKFNAA